MSARRWASMGRAEGREEARVAALAEVEVYFLVASDIGNWGNGPTLEEALRNAKVKRGHQVLAWVILGDNLEARREYIRYDGLCYSHPTGTRCVPLADGNIRMHFAGRR